MLQATADRQRPSAFVLPPLPSFRFQGTQDRISLILGAGFLLSGWSDGDQRSLFQFFPDASSAFLWAHCLVAWRMALALLLLVALLSNVSSRVRASAPGNRWRSADVIARPTCAATLPACLRKSPASRAFSPIRSSLLPAQFSREPRLVRRRLSVEDSEFDRTIYAATWLNVAAQLSAAQSGALSRSLRFAQALMVLGYASRWVRLLDNARLFEQSPSAVSDPLTGLANTAAFSMSLKTRRSARSHGRPFLRAAS